MERFEYKAIDGSGNVLDGAIEAETVAEALDALDRAGFTPLSTRPAQAGSGRTLRERLTPEPKSDHVTQFTIDLAMLLTAGVTLDDALQILGELEDRAWLRRLIRSLKSEIAVGKSFSEALSRHPAQFPPIYARSVEVAEAAGRLGEALASLGRERQRTEAMRRKFVSAISYPVFLVVAALGVLAFVLLYIIPQFEAAISGFRDRMDPSALFVFDLSQAFRDNVDAFVIAVMALLGAALLVKRIGQQRSLWISLLSRLPVTRTIVSHDETTTFCRTLAILTENGVDISAALRLIRGVMRLPRSERRLDAVTAEVRQGRRLSDALASEGMMPHHVVQMLRIGEESGHLADSATRVAVFYEAKLDAALGRLTAVIGPTLMIAVSLLIAWVIISVMSALISINDLLVT